MYENPKLFVRLFNMMQWFCINDAVLMWMYFTAHANRAVSSLNNANSSFKNIQTKDKKTPKHITYFSFFNTHQGL